ncbi:MAG: FCD domain-containing protein, partial [Spirochaetaceae bacterium]|nr:FCD domain-containing protein [Spirochaetaceae bacterium]
VGRSSIRETIKVFNYLGILESKSAKGTFVGSRSSISREALTWALLLGQDDIEMVIDLRGAIEIWCFLQLTIRFRDTPDSTKDILADLNTILGAMSQAIETRNQAAVIQADYDFHRRIIVGVSNQLFVDFYDMLRSFLFKEIEKSQNQYDDRSKILDEHKELLAAMMSGDLEKSANTYMAHISNIKDLLEYKIPAYRTDNSHGDMVKVNKKP